MPELPEVETIRRGLADLIVQKKIKKLNIFNSKSFINDANQDIVGRIITDIHRRAKVLIIDLDHHLSLVIHLKMTGQVIFRPNDKNPTHNPIQKTTPKIQNGFAGGHPTRSMEHELPDKSTRVEIILSNGKLFFNDERKFGWVRLIETDKINALPFFAKAGPDFNEKDLKFATFEQRIKRHPKMKVKAALLDQTITAGLGNIYADETLALSHIHPIRLVSSLSDAELRTIFDSARAILSKAIDMHGSTSRNYLDANGERGDYLDHAYVYGRAGQPCRFCAVPLEKTKLAGRGTVFCPNCQKP